MCFIEKMNCIKIRKKEDCVLDPVRTPSQVKSGTGARTPHILSVIGRGFPQLASISRSRLIPLVLPIMFLLLGTAMKLLITRK